MQGPRAQRCICCIYLYIMVFCCVVPVYAHVRAQARQLQRGKQLALKFGSILCQANDDDDCICKLPCQHITGFNVHHLLCTAEP